MVGKGITSLSSRAKSTGPMRLMTMKAEETYDASGVHDGCSERADDGAYYGEDAENAKLVTSLFGLPLSSDIQRQNLVRDRGRPVHIHYSVKFGQQGL